MSKPLSDLLNIGNATSKTAFTVSIVIAGAIVVGGAIAASWWRRYFRRLFEARLQKQEDGSFLVHWMPRRGQPVEVYRIDAVTKDRVLARLAGGSVVSTGLFVAIIIAAVAINVLWPTLLMIPASLLLSMVAFAPQHYASRQAGRLVVAGTRVFGAEGIRPLAPPPQITATSLRPIVRVSWIAAVIGLAVCVIFLLDPDSGTIAWTDGLTLILLLVVMPLSVALLSSWTSRHTRS
jgi:hypothetical protein